MANPVINSFFPSQVASDQEKMSQDYGLRVGRAIQDEWFSSNSGNSRFQSNQNTFHNLFHPVSRRRSECWLQSQL